MVNHYHRFIPMAADHTINTIPQPLAFFSRSLTKAERNYITFHREQLAVHHAIHHIKHMMKGVPFTIQTDHQPLITVLTKNGDAWPARQQNQLSAIAEFAGLLTYITGTNNPVAHAFSCVTINDVHVGINYQ